MKTLALYMTAIGYLLQLTSASKILIFIPASSKSHKNTFDPLIEELAKRNHEITVVTMYPSSKNISGVKTVDLVESRKMAEEWASNIWMLSSSPPLVSMAIMAGALITSCDSLYNDPAMAEFVANPGKYDVILVNSIANDCYLQFAGTLGAPVIYVSPSVLWLDVAWETNIPQPWSYIPHVYLSYTSDMTFLQRCWNFMVTGIWTASRWLIFHPLSDYVVHKRVPNAPGIREVINNVSFVLVNSHFSFDDPKPSLPYLAEVGGMHCRPAQKLPDVSYL